MSALLLVEQAAEDTPSANQVVLYPKVDGLIYSKDDAGTERIIAQGIATQAQQETGTDETLAVTPGRQQFHPSAMKFYVRADQGGTIQGTAYNVTSITDVGVGKLRVTIATDFSSLNWVSQQGITAQTAISVMVDNSAGTPQGTGTIDLLAVDTANTPADPSYWQVSGEGDQ